MAKVANSDNNDDLVEKIAEEFLEQLRQNENPSTAELAKEHPDLAPQLEKRLKLVESIFNSAKADESEKTQLAGDAPPFKSERTRRERSTVRALPGDFAARFACPHCGNRVQIVGLASNEVTCKSCGSSLKIARPIKTGIGKSALPKQLGRFIVKRILGEGAFGIVYLATDPQLERDVAVKTPRNGFFPSLDEERRFFREAKHAASLQHPNIVQVFEVSDSEGAPLIVSEFIEGLTLNDVANGDLLTFKETARLMIQIANAVEFAHQKGVVHRDLKPGNILLDSDQNSYITDFGLAYRDDAEITMTLDGAILGTPAYMAPEQAEGNQKLVGRRSDVYSLGVILYRLITKDLPFHGTKRMLVKQVINDDPKPPRSLNDRIPRDLQTITLKAMAKSPDARYQTAREMAEELQRFLLGEPVLARPVGNLAKFSRWCSRRPLIASLSGSVAALLLACVGLSSLWAINSNRLTHLATENGLESLHRLHDLLMSNGVTDLKHNNLTNASLWFADALATDDTPNDRIRIAMIQDRMPTLTHLVTGSESCRTAFCSDGSRFVSASPSSIRIFDIQTNKMLFDEEIVGQPFRFSPDGLKLVVATEQVRPNSIALWNVDKRRLTSTIKHDQEIQSFEFDSSSTKLVTGSADSTAKVWDTNDSSLLGQHLFDGFRVARVAFIKDSSSVVVIVNKLGELGCKIVIWDYVKDTLVGNEMLHDSFVSNIRVTSDGKKICAGEGDGTIKVWEVASGSQVGVSILTNKKLWDAQFTAGDTSVIGMFANGEIATFDYQTGSLLTLFVRPTKFELMAQSSDSSILALASVDGRAFFVWRETGVDVCSPINNGTYITSIAFHPDGHRVAVGGTSGALQIWDLAGSCPSSTVFQHDGSISHAIFIPKSSRSLTVGWDGKGHIWDNATGQRVGVTIEHEKEIFCVSSSEDGKFIVTGGLDNQVKVWDSRTGKQVGSSYTHDAMITSVKFNGDGSRIFASDNSGTIRCWEVNAKIANEPNPIFEVQQNAEINLLKLSKDGMTIASSSTDGYIRLWNAMTGEPNAVSFKHKSTHIIFRFLPGNRLVSSGRDDRSVVVWELATGKAVIELPNENGVRDIQVSVNGERIFVIGKNGKADVWAADETGNYKRERTFGLPPNFISLGGSYSTDKSMFAMCGGQQTLQSDEPFRGALNLWNLADGRPLAPIFQQRASFRQLVLSQDAQSILTASDNNTAQLWKISSTNLPPADLQRIARLYAQHIPDSEGSLKLMDIETQRKEFEELKSQHPAYFNLEDTDLKIWDDEVMRNSKD